MGPKLDDIKTVHVTLIQFHQLDSSIETEII